MEGRGQGTRFVTPHKPVPFVGVPGVSGIPEGYYLIGWFPFTDMTHVTNVASQGGIDPSVAMQPWHTPRHAYWMLQCLMVAIQLLTVTKLAELLTFDLMWWRVRCQSENRTGSGKTMNKQYFQLEGDQLAHTLASEACWGFPPDGMDRIQSAAYQKD